MIYKENDTTFIAIMQSIHKSLNNGIRSAKAGRPREWLAQKKLDIDISGACFNSGQMHHRREQEFKERLESVGFLIRTDAPTNNGQIPYTTFGKESIMFPLKNEKNQTINFYAININNEEIRYLNQYGLYPQYPRQDTRKLYIVPCILDAATLLQSRIPDNKEAVLSLFDGELKPQHEQALKKLHRLEEIIWVETIENVAEKKVKKQMYEK